MAGEGRPPPLAFARLCVHFAVLKDAVESKRKVNIISAFSRWISHALHADGPLIVVENMTLRSRRRADVVIVQRRTDPLENDGMAVAVINVDTIDNTDYPNPSLEIATDCACELLDVQGGKRMVVGAVSGRCFRIGMAVRLDEPFNGRPFGFYNVGDVANIGDVEGAEYVHRFFKKFDKLLVDFND